MKKKVLFLTQNLGGGAEKVLVTLVNNLDRSKYDITVETMYDDGVNAKDLSPDVEYISKKHLVQGLCQYFQDYSFKAFVPLFHW